MVKNTVEATRRWRKNNPDKVREYRNRYAKKHPEKVRAWSKRHYAKHKERLKENERMRRINNRDILNARQRARRAENRDRFNEYAKQFRDKNPASGYWSVTKRNAIRLGVDFDLDQEWFRSRLAAGACELSGLPFEFKTKGKLRKRNPNTPSVDRIIPGGPYTKANCRLILWWLNSALSNLGEEYALSVFRAIFIKRGEILAHDIREAA